MRYLHPGSKLFCSTSCARRKLVVPSTAPEPISGAQSGGSARSRPGTEVESLVRSESRIGVVFEGGKVRRRHLQPLSQPESKKLWRRCQLSAVLPKPPVEGEVLTGVLWWQARIRELVEGGKLAEVPSLAQHGLALRAYESCLTQCAQAVGAWSAVGKPLDLCEYLCDQCRCHTLMQQLYSVLSRITKQFPDSKVLALLLNLLHHSEVSTSPLPYLLPSNCPPSQPC